jgi:uncharacterized protein (DUF1697 family)
MPRVVAFLRAINVGGRTVPMTDLRRHFEALGLAGVETFIASGNVVFASRARTLATLEQAIETRLHAALGYEVHTFLRTEAEVAAIAGYQPFSPARMRDAGALNVGFLAAPLKAPEVDRLMSLKTDIDDFHVQGREVYWLCRLKQSQSTFSNQVFERALKVRTTFRGAATIARLAAKYGFVPPAGPTGRCTS